jgi:hypothetical protein
VTPPQAPIPLMDVGSAIPPVPGVPAAVPPPCPTVTLMPGVPAVRFRLTLTVELAFPPDVVVLGFLPERVRAFGLADAFVFVDAGTFFEGLKLTVTPDRGAEPFALVFGAVVVAPPPL